MPDVDMGDQFGDAPGDSPFANPGAPDTPTASPGVAGAIVGPTFVMQVLGNYLKQGDTWPPISAALYDQNGPVDLTTASGVVFKMRGQSTNTVVSAAGTVLAATAGTVDYVWSAGNTAVADTYNAEFQVTFTGGKVITFPNYGYIRVIISDEVA